jgi:hypothetical protein
VSLSIPIVSQFDGSGIKKAIAGFQQLETKGQKAAFVLKKAGQAAALGFAAVGAAALTAGKFMLDFAKIAREDQLAQVQLAGTLKATTKATDAQIKGVEDWIDVTQRATGVADDDLRPAMNRLLRSTSDVSKAQKLLSLALNISGRTGKPLEAVVNGLARASEGQTSALGRLGLGYTKAELKAKSFATIQDELTKQYAGGANEKAATFEGTMARLAITFGELKESLGYYILPYLQTLAESAIKVADAFGKKGFAGGVEELKFQLQFLLYNADGTLNQIGQTLNTVIGIFNKLGQASNSASNTFKAPLALVNAIPGVDLNLPKYGQTPTLAGSVNMTQMQQRSRGVTATQGLGASTYAQRNPQSIVVQVSPVTDPTAVAKEIKRILGQSQRKDGGYGIRVGGK